MDIKHHRTVYVDDAVILKSGAVIKNAAGTTLLDENGLGTLDAVIYKGVIDCSSNPNYPAASAGDLYLVSVAGKIGGGSGTTVEVGDMIICKTDGTVAGTQAAVGTSWNIIQTNLNPALYALLASPTFTGTVGLPAGSASAVAAGNAATNGLMFGTNTVSIVTNGTERVMVNSSGNIVPLTDNSVDLGNTANNFKTVGATTGFEKKGIAAGAAGGYGLCTLKSISVEHTLTNAQTNTLALQIPSGAKLIGTQLRNDTLIEGVDDATGLVPITTYSAVYVTGSSQTINATIAVAKNTKVDKPFDANGATDITSGLTELTLDAGAGNKFTAGGIISAVAYYFEFASITDAA